MTDDLKNNESETTESNDELFERFAITIDKGQDALRIDKFLMQRIENATRNKLQRAISMGMVQVNGKEVKSNYKIKPLDSIVIYSDMSPEQTDLVPEKMELNIVYEDDDLMIINKPTGMVVHPGSGNHNGTLLNGVAYYLQQQNPELTDDVLPRFGLVHRIDKNTSGKYVALVWGDVEKDSGSIVAHVGRNQRFRKLFEAYPDGEHGKDATTHYNVIERFGYVTLVQCVLETGRTHQIRVHMKYMGHPLFNDDFYGGDKIVKGTVYTKYKQFVDNCFKICQRQALHAKTLGFVHPTTGKDMFFEAPLPTDIEQVIEKWRKYGKQKAEI